MTCTVADCREAPVARGLCGTHYHAARRGGTLAESPRVLAEPGEGHQVAFRVRRSTVEAVRTLAQMEGISPSEWYRRAVEAALERETHGG